MKTTLTALLAICLCWAMRCGKGESAADPRAGDDQPLSEFEQTKAKAEKGDKIAQSNLGVMHDSGEGVEQDFKEAAKWYRKSADQGEAMAQNNLGFMYANGQGVEQNYVTACAWWNIAATNGNQNAKKGLPQVAKKMTPDQIAKAEALVKEMLKKNPKLLK